MAVVVPVVSTFDKSGINQATKAFSRLDSSSRKLGQSVKNAFIPAAAAIAGVTAVLVSASKAAMKDQASQVELARTMRATTKATQGQIAQMEQFVSATSLATGTMDDELRPALARLIRGTGSLTKAQKALGLAQDIATATGKPLTAVADALSRAYKGNMVSLGRLSPEVRQLVKHKASLNTILETLTKNFGGAASAAANTLEGRYRILKVTIAETQEEIGYAFLPVLEDIFKVIKEKVLPYIGKLVTALKEEGLAGALRMAKDDMIKFVREADGMTGTLINIAGTVAIVAGAFKAFSVISSITTAVSGLTSALGGLGGVFAGIGAAGLGTMAAAAGLLLSTLYLIVDTLRSDDLMLFVDLVRNAIGLIGNMFITVFKGIRAAFNLIIKGINGIPFVPDMALIPDVDWLKMNYDTAAGRASRAGSGGQGVRMMAEGGIVTRPTFAMVGEAGPEAVIPLSKAGGFGGPQIIVQTGVGDPVAIGKAVVEALVAYQRRSGALPLKVI